jgi:Fe2+ or Zn2+ uptake regulation protein
MQDPDILLTERLRERGLRVTPQRLIAYRVLRRLNRHVTAEELLTAMAERIPNVALPTVYATLDLLEELHLVRRIATVGGTAVYDPMKEPHQHMLCTRCGAIDDLAVNVDLSTVQAAATATGFQPAGLEVVVRGICQTCGRRSAS